MPLTEADAIDAARALNDSALRLAGERTAQPCVFNKLSARVIDGDIILVHIVIVPLRSRQGCAIVRSQKLLIEK